MAKLKLDEKQIAYVMAKVAIPNKQQAIEYFARLMKEEQIDPKRIGIYVHLMMTKDGVR